MTERAWYLLDKVDVAPMVAVLGDLEWLPGGAAKGQFAMIEAFPPRVAAAAEPIFEKCLAHFPDRTRGFTVLSKVVPGQVIESHMDNHDGRCRIRIHVPLTSNPGAWFDTGDDHIQMLPGYVFVIDPMQRHGVRNEGETDRIHLIFNARQ